MLKIRPFEWKDAEALNSRLDDPKVVRYLPVGPKPLEETIEYFAEVMRDGGIVLVAEQDGRVAGSVEIQRGKRKAAHVGTIGIALKKEFWGQGIGTKLMKEGIRLARNAGLKKVKAPVYAPNKRSINLLKDLGFRLAGRLRKEAYIEKKYYDELVFEKLL